MSNLAKQLVLVCEICDWEPSKKDKLEIVQMHNKVEHDIDDEVRLVMIPKCTCDTLMEQRGSPRKTGGGSKLYYICPDCAISGYVYQRED